MRIGIDFHAAEREGSGNCTYIRNLVESLLQKDTYNDYFLYVTKRTYAYYVRFESMPNVHIIFVPFRRPIMRLIFLSVKSYIDKLDILHVQYIAPPFNRGKLVVMIHDISYVIFPKCFSRLEVLRQRVLIPLNLARASKILTASLCSKKDIVNYYHIKPDKIAVTYNGVDPTFIGRDAIDDKDGDEELHRLKITKNFILFVGRLDARKNIAALIQAFCLLKKEKKLPLQLVLVGCDGYLSDSVKRDLSVVDFRSEIIFTGYVPDSSLPILYGRADVFVYPSFYEGFGLPCLEAMACGCPVIASSVSSLPEIVEEAGVLVDPNSIDEISNAIYRVITNVKLRQDLIAKGLRKARSFTWDKTAHETFAIYNELVHG